MYNYCVDGTTEAKCYTFQSVDFESEEQIFDILLDILKSQLPNKLKKIKDCQDKYMHISEDAIDLYPPKYVSKFSVILNPLGDVPNYYESLAIREVTYNFELILTVVNELERCITWELIRFKNAVESLLMSVELYIDGYESAIVEPRGFAYNIPEVDSGQWRRQGAYRFAVTVTQTQQNY